MRSSFNSKRNPSLPKGRQVNDFDKEEVLYVLGNLPIQRDLLIEAFHKLQDELGCLKLTHLGALAEIFSMSQAEVYEVASFYHHFDIIREDESEPPAITIRVCDGLSCEMEGALSLISNLQNSPDSTKIRVQEVPGIGRCANIPEAGCLGKYPGGKIEPILLRGMLGYARRQYIQGGRHGIIGI